MDGLDFTKRATILVVDDASDNLILVNDVLKNDYSVKTANSAAKALKIAVSKSPPDLILLDIMMPEIDGYEACARLKRDPNTRNIPVIFLTAKCDTDDETKGLELGAVDYITKPISPLMLMARIKNHLALKAMADFLRDKSAFLELELTKRMHELTAAQEIAVKNRQLEQEGRMKAEFLANLSHELTTPINSIIGFSEGLFDGLMGKLTPQQRECVGDIFNSGKAFLLVITDILDLSKVEAGKMPLDLSPLQAATLVEAGLHEVREAAAAHHLELVADIETGLGDVWLDESKVMRIICNLLSNAVKFTKEGGKVHVELRRVGCSGVPAAGFDHYLELRVSDTGIGVSTADQAFLFQPFTQRDSRLAHRYQGTGLGLTMVKRLAELHGGAVAVRSEQTMGSTFTVWLPWRIEGDKRPGRNLQVLAATD